MKRIVFVFILSIVLVGMSIPVLAAEHSGRGHGGGHAVARGGHGGGYDRGYHGGRGYYGGGYYADPVYVPPPVYYAPNPYPAPGINFVIPLHIR